jgi:hypothetical protein
MPFQDENKDTAVLTSHKSKRLFSYHSLQAEKNVHQNSYEGTKIPIYVLKLFITM